ncbi:LysM peptidoglycan-binding domain-containing protein [Kitasatospora sp. NPDC088134]|uniref:LysM peptidoglycan-binding domain-containing protein n=1 Tax=Kitasatospora sp. NPDC088134 TaxID=3364071 RepID=UPI00382CF3E8
MSSTLKPGEALAVDEELLSDNGRFRLSLQSDGNLVLSDLGTGQPLWATATDGRGATSAQMQGDGNFVLYGGPGEVLWSTGTDGSPDAYLRLNDDGNLVVGGDRTRWESGTRVADVRAAEPAPVQAFEPEPQPEPQPEPVQQQTYTVQSGDSLWAVAERFYGDGSQYQRIADANGIANPDLINAGQTLVIP